MSKSTPSLIPADFDPPFERAFGLPRETARRKLESQRAAGKVARDADG